MISQHNLRFVTKVLVAAISLVGLTACYVFIAGAPVEDPDGVKVVTIDPTPTASIAHTPEESLVVEAQSDTKAEPNVDKQAQKSKVTKVEKSKKLAVKPSPKAAAVKIVSPVKSNPATKPAVVATKQVKPIKVEKTTVGEPKKSTAKNGQIAGMLTKK